MTLGAHAGQHGAEQAGLADRDERAPQHPVLSASTIPMPMPYSVPRRPVVMPKGIASSVITSVTNGNASFRCRSTMSGIDVDAARGELADVAAAARATVIISAIGCAVSK